MAKPALGRGLGELLDPGKTDFCPPQPGVERVNVGGVERLLRGKKEEAPQGVPEEIKLAVRASAPPREVVWALALADCFLVAAGATIVTLNTRTGGNWRLVFGLGLVAVGGWLGWLAWRLRRGN